MVYGVQVKVQTPAQRMRRGLTTLAVVGLALATSLISGTPPRSELPEVTLGWPVLLHVERAGALLLVAGAMSLIVYRATTGDFPVRFAHVEYDRGRTAEIVNHEDRLRRLETLALVRDPHLENGDEPA